MSKLTHPAFISYPARAQFGRILPKNKIYEHSGATKRLKSMFVEQIEQIVWQYKLAPETINLSAKPGVPEIQIFCIQLKTPDFHQDVLRCIDRAVQFPIIFEVSFDDKTQVAAAYKRPSESDSNRWVLSDYFATAWLPSDARRSGMPIVLDLNGLYEQIMRQLIALPPRLQENLSDLVARAEKIASKRREVTKAAGDLAKEKQFNRKVEVNANLRQLKNELEQLISRGEA